MLAAVVVAVALIVLLISRVHGAVSATRTASHAPQVLVGQPAPDFTLPLWNGTPGETERLSALKGHPIVLNFWASWCDPCTEEAPILTDAWRTYGTRGAVFLGLAWQTDQQDGLRFLHQYGVTYPCGPAPESMATTYMLPGLPVTVLVDRHGVIAQRFVGSLPRTSFDQTLQSLLSAAT
jgi:cytochrome c biogenesis protein CcmG, thiol:disulfide interchange protein DsbE